MTIYGKARFRLSCLLFKSLIPPGYSGSNKTDGCFVLLLFHLISDGCVVFFGPLMEAYCQIYVIWDGCSQSGF